MDMLILFLTIIAWPVAIVTVLAFVIFVCATFFLKMDDKVLFGALAGRVFIPMIVSTGWLITQYLS
jgi:hypothetical protein